MELLRNTGSVPGLLPKDLGLSRPQLRLQPRGRVPVLTLQHLVGKMIRELTKLLVKMLGWDEGGAQATYSSVEIRDSLSLILGTNF